MSGAKQTLQSAIVAMCALAIDEQSEALRAAVE
jgi:hypothetical protein